MIVNWRQRELTLEDILSDPITKEVMKADSVDPHQLSAMLKETARTWAMLMPEFNVLADVTKCVSEQRAAEKGSHVMNSRRS